MELSLQSDQQMLFDDALEFYLQSQKTITTKEDGSPNEKALRRIEVVEGLMAQIQEEKLMRQSSTDAFSLELDAEERDVAHTALRYLGQERAHRSEAANEVAEQIKPDNPLGL